MHKTCDLGVHLRKWRRGESNRHLTGSRTYPLVTLVDVSEGWGGLALRPAIARLSFRSNVAAQGEA